MAFQIAIVSDDILRDYRTYADAKAVINANETTLGAVFNVGGTCRLAHMKQLLMRGTNSEIRNALAPHSNNYVESNNPSNRVIPYMCRKSKIYLVAIRGVSAQYNCIRQSMLEKQTNRIQVQELIDVLQKADQYEERVSDCVPD